MEKESYTVVEVDRDDMARMNQCAMLLIEYFLHVAHWNVDDINPNDWTRLSMILNNFKDGQHKLFLAYSSEADEPSKPVGVCGVNRQGCAQHLYIQPDFRGKGLAKALVSKQFDNGAWFTTVLNSNTASLSLMRKLGLIEVGTYEDLILFMRKQELHELDENAQESIQEITSSLEIESNHK